MGIRGPRQAMAYTTPLGETSSRMTIPEGRVRSWRSPDEDFSTRFSAARFCSFAMTEAPSPPSVASAGLVPPRSARTRAIPPAAVRPNRRRGRRKVGEASPGFVARAARSSSMMPSQQEVHLGEQVRERIRLGELPRLDPVITAASRSHGRRLAQRGRATNAARARVSLCNFGA